MSTRNIALAAGKRKPRILPRKDPEVIVAMLRDILRQTSYSDEAETLLMLRNGGASHANITTDAWPGAEVCARLLACVLNELSPASALEEGGYWCG